MIKNNGYAYMSVLINKFKIKDILGKVVIIHDSPDDFKTQPSGNSGTKIACGKIDLRQYLYPYLLLIQAYHLNL